MASAGLARGIAELNRRWVEAMHRLPLRRDAAAWVLFPILALVMTNPLVFHLANAVEDKQDGLLNTWIIAWVGHALVTDPLHLFDTNIFYPYARTLAFSEALLPQGLLALPVNLAANNTVLGYNLVLLFSFFLAAYAMYLLIFDLTHHRGAALVSGVIFAFNPYNLGNIAQIQLLSFGWLPLALLFLRRILQSSTFSVRDTILFALFFSLQSLSSIYYAFLSGIAVALCVLWYVAIHRPFQLRFYISRAARLLFAAAVIALLILPVLIPYLHVQSELGFQRKIEESEPFSASLKLFTEVSPQNVLYGSLLAPHPPVVLGGYPLDNLFPGLVALALACAGIIAGKRREKWLFSILLFVAFTLALGPRLFLSPSVGTAIVLPYQWLYDAFSVTHAFRAPVRFDALVMLALAALAGLGLSRFSIRNWQVALILSLVSLEYLAVPAAAITPVPTGAAIPPYVHWLAQQAPTRVLELPMLASDPNRPLDLTTQYLSTYHWQETPDGYSGFVPRARGGIAYEVGLFPSERSIRLLQALNVQYVIVHSERMPDWSALQGKIGQSKDLQPVQQFGSDYIYGLTPRALDGSALSASIYLPDPIAPGEPCSAYLIVQNHSEASVAVKPTDTLQLDVRWNNGATQKATAALPLVTSRVSVVPMSLLAPSRAGSYHLDVSIRGDGIGPWNLSSDVSVRAEEPGHQTVLPAGVLFGSPLQPTYKPGETVSVNVVWQALNKIDAYYSASVRIVDAHGNKVAQQDRQPAGETMLWIPGTTVPDKFSLELPLDLKAGEYTVQVKMYQADLGIDALLLDERYLPREVITLGRFTVNQ